MQMIYCHYCSTVHPQSQACRDTDRLERIEKLKKAEEERGQRSFRNKAEVVTKKAYEDAWPTLNPTQRIELIDHTIRILRILENEKKK